MSMRVKLMFAGVPLALALALVVVVSVIGIDSLAAISNGILKENYRSVIAAQRMKESIERLDSAALFRVLGETEKADALVVVHRVAFEAELGAQEDNITETGEDAVTARLHDAWIDYHHHYEEFRRTPTAETYFSELEPRFLAVKSAADEVLALNQDAMVRKSDAARQTAEDTDTIVTWSSVVAIMLGLFASARFASRVLRPLDNLSLVARRLGEGDLSARAGVLGKDEIAAVATEFNEMAARLEAFRKSSLGELLQAQLAAQATIDSIPDPVVVFGTGGRALNYNESANVDLHLAVAEDNPLATVEPTLRAALEHARDHVLSGKGPYVPQGFQHAVAVVSPDGQRWYLPRAAPLYDERGGVTGATLIVQDVTRLRRFDELRDNMVATVAHEFRTPLTSLRMAIHLCVEGAAGDLNEKQLDLLGAAREDCERLHVIVVDLLDLARFQAGKVELDREPRSPEDLVEQTLSDFREEAQRRQVTLEALVTPSLDDVLVDRSRVLLVFANIVSNALRHSPPGGTVTLRAEPAPECVRFTIKDEGSGIPEEYCSRIFDRFFRVPHDPASGAGLGLSISREIIETHGGKIGVTSAPERGAAFWFTLPTHPAPSRREA
jgi:two-component system, NtrC family, sensor histidine kinase KinB